MRYIYSCHNLKSSLSHGNKPTLFKSMRTCAKVTTEVVVNPQKIVPKLCTSECSFVCYTVNTHHALTLVFDFTTCKRLVRWVQGNHFSLSQTLN